MDVILDQYEVESILLEKMNMRGQVYFNFQTEIYKDGKNKETTLYGNRTKFVGVTICNLQKIRYRR